jgi:hypothetical protein
VIVGYLTIAHYSLCLYGNTDDFIPWISWLEKQKPVEWSEEDEEMINDTIRAFQLAYPYALENENPRKKNIDWLKSLKP